MHENSTNNQLEKKEPSVIKKVIKKLLNSKIQRYWRLIINKPSLDSFLKTFKY